MFDLQVVGVSTHTISSVWWSASATFQPYVWRALAPFHAKVAHNVQHTLV